MSLLAAADYDSSSFTLSPVTAFLLVIGVTLFLSVMTGLDTDEVADIYTANRSLSVVKNALAATGDYVSALTLLSATGLVALVGYDGITLGICTVLALGVLLLIAEPLRNTGRFTLGDSLEARIPGSATRIAGAVVTLLVCLPYIVSQLSAVGTAVAGLVGLEGPGPAKVCIVLIGALMICFAAYGGMRGVSLIQILKAVLVFGAMLAIALLVLDRFDFDIAALLDGAARGSGLPDAYFSPGRLYPMDVTGRLNVVSLYITLIAGASCTPHMLMRVNVARSGPEARRATRHTMLMVAAFCGSVIVAGLGASALVGAKDIVAADPRGNSALLELAGHLAGGPETTGGSILYTLVASAVFITTLAVVSGLTLAAAATLAHDVYAHASRRGRLAEGNEVGVARWFVVLVGSVSVLLAVGLYGWDIQFVGGFSVGLAASAILPALLYSLFWSRFTRTGLLWSMYGGTICCFVLLVFGPNVSGTPVALLPDQDFHWWPLETTGLVSVPVGFLLGWAGSVRSRRRTELDRHAEMEARALAGVGAE
ncbi:cation acetate symporter [Peterkaempfera sp. SMS 1(5)a]|uniref:sodium/solute symporter n=1 Tax=Peterkaempfera podocarpi TaxID=3232308 RepID=UPI0036731DBA